MSPDSGEIKHDTDIHLLLERGRRISVKSDAGVKWDAVYWGSDDDGDIVAWQVGEHWQFIHQTLPRELSKLSVGGLLSSQEIHEIEQDLRKSGIVKDNE